MRFLLLFAFSILAGCSGCSNGSGSGPDSGTDTGTGTSGDTDTDTDSDTDSDTDTDTDTVPEGFVPDAGPWEWTDLPDSGDCGQAGCRQLTFSHEVRELEWDVWDDLLSFNDETFNTYVVNHAEGKQLTMPNVYPAIDIGPPDGSANLYPATIYNETVCYSKLAGNETEIFTDVICADLDAEIQQLVYHRPKFGDDFPNPAKYSDLYGTRLVSVGGCGDVMDSGPLCVFDIETPGTYEETAPDGYGGHNSMWGDIVVWTLAYTGNDIRGYNFSTQQFIEVTDDDNTEHQLAARIHGDRVVYSQVA